MAGAKNTKTKINKVKDFVFENKVILLIILLALILRFLWLKEYLFFGFEQGRDFLKLNEIAHGDLALIGPKTDIDGVFHGALSYYLLFPLFIVSAGNPYFVQLMLVVIHLTSIYILYKFLVENFDKKVGLISAFFYSFSYPAIVYSRWLSNPNLVPVFFIIFIFGLYKLKKNRNYLYIVAIALLVLLHIEAVALIAVFFPLLIYLLLEKVKLPLKSIIYCAGITLAFLSTYIVFNIKNNNILVNGILNIFSSGKIGLHDQIGLLDEFRNEIVDNLFFFSPKLSLLLYAILLAFLLAKSLKGRKYLYILVMALFPFLYLILGIKTLRHFFILYPVIMSIVVGIFIKSLLDSKFKILGLFAVIALLVSHGAIYVKWIPINRANFLYHAQRMYYSDELNLIDFVYSKASKNNFSYDYFSIPYWKREAWDYLFSTYGKRRYGYVPEADRTDVFFVLYEPDETQPLYQENWYKSVESMSTLLIKF